MFFLSFTKNKSKILGLTFPIGVTINVGKLSAEDVFLIGK